jgi:serine/threonine protein kinase
MRPHRHPTTPVRSADDLLLALRAARLLSARRCAALAGRWGETADPRCCVLELVSEGVLTAYQAKEVLAGRASRLRLGPYLLLEPLGAGGMGRVFKARHRLSRHTVALKVVATSRPHSSEVALHQHVSEGAAIGKQGEAGSELSRPKSGPATEALAQLRREAEAAMRLRHPNIVTAHGAEAAGGVFYLALEYLEGIDLGQLVLAEGPLSVPLACEVVRQAAEALSYAHEHGFVHHDVKPANLFLVRPADRCGAVLVKLLDLGLAQRIEEGLPERLDGTPDFMAPERGQEGGQADPRSDLYSLGCTFYYLLTGEVPFPGGNWTEKLLRHRLDDPPSVRDLRPEVPAAVADIVSRLMARAPEDRYPSAAAVAETLAGLDRAVPPCGRRTPLAAVMTAAILTGLLAAWCVRWVANPPPPPRIVHHRPAPRRAARPPFHAEGRDFADLAEAIAATRDGGRIIVHGTGPHRLRPLAWRGKTLTLRAAPGVRPCLETDTAGTKDQPLLCTDRPLTLEGLELRRAADGAGEPSAGPLVSVQGASLHLSDCRLHGPDRGPTVVCRGGDLLVRCSRILAGAVGLSVEAEEHAHRHVHLVETTIRTHQPGGLGLLLSAPRAARSGPLDIRLERCTLEAGEVIRLQAVPGTLAIAARGNRFCFRAGVLAYAGYPEGNSRPAATWHGHDNCYEPLPGGTGAWLCVDGRPAPVRDLHAWRILWGTPEPGSTAGITPTGHDSTAGARLEHPQEANARPGRREIP